MEWIQIMFLNLKENTFQMRCIKGNMDTQYIEASISWLDFSAAKSLRIVRLIKDQEANIELFHFVKSKAWVEVFCKQSMICKELEPYGRRKNPKSKK